jgi:C4-dicarboxylate-specific signal transduction histidine kinase
MTSKGTAEFEARALRKNGTSFHEQVLMVKIAGPAGNLIGHHCFMRDITDRKRAETEKEETQQKLLEVSRHAGMAEVATNVLHNVGNVLNSVNVSATLVADKLRHLQVSDLVAVTELMRQRAGDLGTFITTDEKGKLLPQYLGELGKHLVHEQGAVLQELESLTANIGHIKDIVNTQQSYARVSGVVEEVSLAELVETALRFNSAAMKRHKVHVVREFDRDLPVLVDKHKVLQILVNLISNAKYAVDNIAPEDRRMTVRIERSADQADFVRIAVIDNGVGISRENLTRIFAHGFTTKKDGHGFGLHGSALSAKELGGTLTAHSDGPDRGATFALEIPLRLAEVPK